MFLHGNPVYLKDEGHKGVKYSSFFDVGSKNRKLILVDFGMKQYKRYHNC